jgi:hypothetical protein
LDRPSIDELILKGILEVSSVDSETGEFLYNFTDRVYELLPTLLEDQIESLQDDILYFVDNGFLEMIEDDETRVKLTPKAFSQEDIAELPPDKRRALASLKKFFER